MDGDYKNRAISGFFWHFLMIFLSAPLSYLVRIIYDRNIPIVEVGLFYATLDLISIIAVIRELGLNYSLVHFIPKLHAKKKKGVIKAVILLTARVQLAVSATVTLFTIIFSRQIVLYYLARRTEIPDVRIATAVVILGAIGAIIDCMTGISVSSVLGFQEQKLYSFFNTIKMGSVLAVSSIMIFIFNVRNAIAPSVAYLLTPAVLFIIYSYFLVKRAFPEFFRVRAEFSRKLLSQIVRYAIPLAASSIGILVMVSIDGICLTYFSGLEQVGIYKNAVVPTANLLLYLPAAITAVLFPMFSELWAKGKKKIISAGISQVVNYSLIIILPLAIFIAAFPTVILNILWTPKNIVGAQALRLLALGTIFYTIFVIFSSFIRATGDSIGPMKIVYASAILNLVGDVLLIPFMGMTGAALTTLIALAAQAAMAFLIAAKKVEIRIEWKRVLMNTFAALTSIIAILIVKEMFNNIILKLAVSAAAYFTVYLVLILTTGVLRVQELKEIKEKLLSG